MGEDGADEATSGFSVLLQHSSCVRYALPWFVVFWFVRGAVVGAAVVFFLANTRQTHFAPPRPTVPNKHPLWITSFFYS